MSSPAIARLDIENMIRRRPSWPERTPGPGEPGEDQVVRGGLFSLVPSVGSR
jgi:hypothetical protein